MNLSDHSVSVSQSIQQLRKEVQKVTENVVVLVLDGLFSQWGIRGWLKGVLRTGLLILAIIIIALSILPCVLSLLQRALQRTIPMAYLVQKQKGGIVEDLGWTSGPGEDIGPGKITVFP